MDKRRAIQIMTKAAQLYKEHLEDQKVLFLYGLPKEVNKQLQESNKILSSLQGYEVVFHRYNFLHLTGVRLNKKETASAIHFYQKCLDKRLTENDFVFAKDGSTGQKLAKSTFREACSRRLPAIQPNGRVQTSSRLRIYRSRTEIIYRKSCREYLWLYWLRKR